MTFPGGPLNPDFRTTCIQNMNNRKNLILYFALIAERMNHSGNKQPVTKSGLTCKPTLKSSEVEAFVSILRHKILMKYKGMRP